MLSLQSATMREGTLKLGYTSVIFVGLGVKVDGTNYRDLLLSQQLLSAICHVSSTKVCILENSAPAYRAPMLSDINISQGSIATPLRYGGICNGLFTANFLVNEF